jgi:predicted phosphate transport protein (TIGR00153 family)
MLSKMTPKKLDFFDLFERHAKTSVEGTALLAETLAGWPGTGHNVSRIEEVEHACDNITHMTIDLMRRTYITPFERDEIRELISRLDDVMDHAQGAASRLELFKIQSVPSHMIELSKVLARATEQVHQAVMLLRNIKKAQEIQTYSKEINRLENEGDRILKAGLAELFENEKDPIAIMKLKEVYERLESATDRCEDVANVLEGILIEHVG